MKRVDIDRDDTALPPIFKQQLKLGYVTVHMMLGGIECLIAWPKSVVDEYGAFESVEELFHDPERQEFVHREMCRSQVLLN